MGLFDSQLYRSLFDPAPMPDFFDEAATLSRWLEVEVVLARTQASLGMIPPDAAEAIARVARLASIDLEKLGDGIAQTGRGIRPLLEQLRKVGGPLVDDYLHFGSTTQDILDTAFILQMRDALEVIEQERQRLTRMLASLARQHQNSVMVARTNGQDAAPTTFGLHLCAYLGELERHGDRVRNVRGRFSVQCGGSVGTLAAFGVRGLELRAALAKALNLAIPRAPWNASRDVIVEVIQLLTAIVATLGRLGEDVNLLSATALGELREGGAGGESSAMPNKKNPRHAECLGTLARLGRMLQSGACEIPTHTGTRQGGPWMMEWAIVPEAFQVCAAALRHGGQLIEGLEVDVSRMRANFAHSGHAVLSEALLVGLIPRLGRSRAYATVREALQEAENAGGFEVSARQHPVICEHCSEAELRGMLDPTALLGAAVRMVEEITNATHPARLPERGDSGNV